MAKPEQDLQLAVCRYIGIQYPRVIFFSEPSGLRVSIGQAMLLKKMRSHGKLPDMFLAVPNGKYHGFFIELKIEGTTIFKRNGEMVACERIREQFKTLSTLYDLGYAACFGVGFDDVKKKIDKYMKLENIESVRDAQKSSNP